VSNQTVKKLDVLIRANTPIVVIESAEEARVLTALETVAEAHGVALVTWSRAQGFEAVREPAGKVPGNLVEPTQALLAAGNHAKTHDLNADNQDPTVWVFKDLHPWFKRKPQVVRALRDAVPHLMNSQDVFVLVSPAFETPPDLEKDIHLVDFPLPSSAEIKERVDDFIHNLPTHVDVNLNGDKRGLIHALQGLTDMEADAVLAQAVVTHGALDKRVVEFVLDAKEQIISKSPALEFERQKAGYDDIGGIDLLKAHARDAERASTPEAKAFGIEAPKGLLLVGPPGTGKSLLSRAVAGANRPLIRFEVGAVFGHLLGQSQSQMRQALKIVEAAAPCVLRIDEIEKALPGNGGGEMDGGARSDIFGTLLTWMEEKAKDVFIVATSNNADNLRPELVQRFGDTFFVDLPDLEARKEIIEIHIRKKDRDPAAYDVQAIAEATENFSGREIRNLVNAALMLAFKEGVQDATRHYLQAATMTVTTYQSMQAEIESMRAWSEKARPASSTQKTGNQAMKQAATSRVGALRF
jgi:ATP-dependent 26S proteasome regulatory subunit